MVTPRQLVAGRPNLFTGIAAGVVAWLLLGLRFTGAERGIMAWDLGGLTALALYARLFSARHTSHMEADAERQQAGEWALFAVTIAATVASLAAILGEFGNLKGVAPDVERFRVGLVVLTLLVSWLLFHALFAIRYAHEYYARQPGAPAVDGGLDFPCDDEPDYWDFFYFSAVLGMTFQVSDVQITSRALRRLAIVHGLLSFGFNTVILALTVNLAAGLL